MDTERESTAWVMESGSCNLGDHEVVEVFIGSKEQASARAAELSAGRRPADEVHAWAARFVRADYGRNRE